MAKPYALAGRYDEARGAWSEVLKLDPKMTAGKMFPKIKEGARNNSTLWKHFRFLWHNLKPGVLA